MARTAKPETTEPTDPAAPTLAADLGVNNGAENQASEPLVNAPDPVTPENTPIPGGGSWGWDHLHACWVESAETAAPPLPTLE